MAIRTDEFKVAGISYYQGDFINKLNFDIDNDECEFDSSSVELIPEPENKYDPNAIKVMVDGIQIGHIPRNITSYVRNLIDSPDLSEMRILIVGEIDDDDPEESNLSATVFIYTHEDDIEEQKTEKDYSILAKIELTLGILLLIASLIILEIGFIIFALIIIAHSSYYLYKRKHDET